MKRILVPCGAVLLSGLWLSGCDRGPATDRGPDSEPPASVAQGPDGPAERPATRTDDRVTVQVKSWEETQRLVDEHAGKVVVIDLWTSW